MLGDKQHGLFESHRGMVSHEYVIFDVRCVINNINECNRLLIEKLKYYENISRFIIKRNAKFLFSRENIGIGNKDSKGSVDGILYNGCKASPAEEKELSIVEKG